MSSPTPPPAGYAQAEGSQRTIQRSVRAGGDASKNSQGRNSEADQASVFHFTRPGNTSHSKAFLNSRIFFVLQLNSADHGLESKIADFKADLIQDIQAKSYEAFIDADLTAERLHSILMENSVSCHHYKTNHRQCNSQSLEPGREDQDIQLEYRSCITIESKSPVWFKVASAFTSKGDRI